jgi:hypothetical protein
MKNSQLAVLSGVILAGAVIVAASNWLTVRSLRQEAGVRNHVRDSGCPVEIQNLDWNDAEGEG